MNELGGVVMTPRIGFRASLKQLFDADHALNGSFYSAGISRGYRFSLLSFCASFLGMLKRSLFL